MLATLLFAATLVAQEPITPEDVLSIREVRELQISTDGKQVAFRVREPADPRQPRAPRAENIWVVPTDGNEPPRPLIANLKNANTPRWSPDGRWLAFLSDHSGADGVQVYVMRNGGVTAARLTSVPGGVEDYAWSPDSTMIAFVARDQPRNVRHSRRPARPQP